MVVAPQCAMVASRAARAKRKACQVWVVDAALPHRPHVGTTMTSSNINLIALALCFAFSTGSMAVGMSKTGWKAGKASIGAEYKVSKAACAPWANNANYIWVAEAKAKQKLANAELDTSHKPSATAHCQAPIVKAEAASAVANENCDQMAGSAEGVCVKEGKARSGNS